MQTISAEVVQANTVTAIEQARVRAESYVQYAKAENTVRAYQAAWRHFEIWCAERNLASLPSSPATIALYLSDVAATTKPATLKCRLAAISKAHQVGGYTDSPASMKHAAVSEVWKGIRRVHGVSQTQKTPTLIEDVRRMVGCVAEGPNLVIAARDSALLLLGFAGAFRRSEVVALNFEDVQQTLDGLVITLRRSKTDQDGQGRKVGIPYGSTPSTCPVRAYQRWMELSGITDGPVFRSVDCRGRVQAGRLSDKRVALVVKRYAEAAGLDPDMYAGHSLRAGLVTSAAVAGVSERTIMQQTGHKSVTMVRRYIRELNLFRENAAARIGL